MYHILSQAKSFSQKSPLMFFERKTIFDIAVRFRPKVSWSVAHNVELFLKTIVRSILSANSNWPFTVFLPHFPPRNIRLLKLEKVAWEDLIVLSVCRLDAAPWKVSILDVSSGAIFIVSRSRARVGELAEERSMQRASWWSDLKIQGKCHAKIQSRPTPLGDRIGVQRVYGGRDHRKTSKKWNRFRKKTKCRSC